MVLTFEGEGSFVFNQGSFFVLGACLCWGFENNCTKMISNKSSVEIVVIKGTFSGLGSLLVALIVGERIPAFQWLLCVLVLGFVAYGLSIHFSIMAQKDLGAAKTSAYYSIAPFLGVAFGMLLLGERPGVQFYIALIIMIISTYFMVKDTIELQHTHEHKHGDIVHTHMHTHSGDSENHTHKHELSKMGFLSLLSIIFLLSGCGQGDNPIVPTSDSYVNQEMKANITKTEEKKETCETDENSESLTKPLEVPVNTQAEAVPYLSEDGIDPMRAIHRCVSDGKNIFLAYNEPDIFVMPIGADKHSPANIENPDGMSVCNVAIDTYGKIHLLMAGQNYEEWYIWCLDEDYQFERGIDISAYFETKQMPMWFLIDKDGTFYLQWSLNRNGIILDREGVMLHKTTPETLGLGWIYEAAVGKDGQIYLAYKDDDKLEIGALDVENCSIKKEASSLSFANNETFSAMSAGTDTNLLLYSPNSGVWAYDNENGVLENRVALSDICFGDGMEYWPLTFVPDGRLLLLGKTVNNDTNKDIELLMKYIPAGR